MPFARIAASTGPAFPVTDVVVWAAVLIAAVIVGTIVIAWVRRMLTAESDAGEDPFTLQGLRELHASGTLSDDEFERAKTALIARLRGGRGAPEDRVRRARDSDKRGDRTPPGRVDPDADSRENEAAP